MRRPKHTTVHAAKRRAVFIEPIIVGCLTEHASVKGHLDKMDVYYENLK